MNSYKNLLMKNNKNLLMKNNKNLLVYRTVISMKTIYKIKIKCHKIFKMMKKAYKELIQYLLVHQVN